MLKRAGEVAREPRWLAGIAEVFARHGVAEPFRDGLREPVRRLPGAAHPYMGARRQEGVALEAHVFSEGPPPCGARVGTETTKARQYGAF